MIISQLNTVWHRMFDRLALKYTGDPFVAEVMPVIVPVHEIEPLLQTYHQEITSTVDPGATGIYTLKTIPSDERWKLYSIHIKKVAGTSLTTSILKVKDTGSGVSTAISTYTATADTTISYDTRDVIIEAGWKIEVNVAAYTAGDTLQSELWYRKEKAF